MKPMSQYGYSVIGILFLEDEAFHIVRPKCSFNINRIFKKKIFIINFFLNTFANDF